MDVLRKILIAVMGLLFLAFSALIGVGMINHGFASTAVDFLDRCFVYNMQLIFVNGENLWQPIVAGLAGIILGVLLLFVALYRKQLPHRMHVSAPDGYVVEISQEAIDTVVRRAVANVKQVSGMNGKLFIKDETLTIELNIVVPAEDAIPEIGSAVRNEVATQVEAMTGIVPKEIRVRVSRVVDKQEG